MSNWTEEKIRGLVRPNILTLTPYSSARSEFKGVAEVLLDANESPYDNGVNRYPDPLAKAVRSEIAKLKGVGEDQIMLGNGSDELVDYVSRIFCHPGRDAVVALPPTFGMYKVAAGINDLEFRAVTLQPDFTIPVEELKASWDERSTLLWLCSPNNPSGNATDPALLEELIRSFPGIVALDEAYIDFIPEQSFVPRLAEFPNLVILQTLSKGWGMAGARVGMAFASPLITKLMLAIKPPYNVNVISQERALAALREPEAMRRKVDTLIGERKYLETELAKLDCVDHIFPSVTNFLLVRFTDGQAVYEYLLSKGIVVRNQTMQPNAANCLRITAGLRAENDRLLSALREYRVTERRTE